MSQITYETIRSGHDQSREVIAELVDQLPKARDIHVIGIEGTGWAEEYDGTGNLITTVPTGGYRYRVRATLDIDIQAD